MENDPEISQEANEKEDFRIQSLKIENSKLTLALSLEKYQRKIKEAELSRIQWKEKSVYLQDRTSELESLIVELKDKLQIVEKDNKKAKVEKEELTKTRELKSDLYTLECAYDKSVFDTEDLERQCKLLKGENEEMKDYIVRLENYPIKTRSVLNQKQAQNAWKSQVLRSELESSALLLKKQNDLIKKLQVEKSSLESKNAEMVRNYNGKTGYYSYYN